ncbi:Shedu anti-phage system protein SduA domain-containing protein [Rathayibacter festucae]|uniref:Shedu anti-phage system protein SduA domain-containing protein n=1 Tax=Rathayibacter festucae TaxID=110937 RepID=UPI002A6AF69C|nr:Shedu anti-phage system protein SduA domain-containing protein [Rathayibacter festucae]MDY0912409.1 DUF4263 domain-containing protein [Rathayibacter festucae]
MAPINLSNSHDPLIDPSNPQPTAWTVYETNLRTRWSELLETESSEEETQRFLEWNPSLVPGVNEYNTGHHSPLGGVLYSQPQLRHIGKNRQPDFMWLGKTSAEITPVLIEIEKPGLRWFTKKGNTTAHFNQAHGQLSEWKSWFARPDNASHFRERYLSWPEGLSSALPMNPTYILVFGRRREFEGENVEELIRHRAQLARSNEVLMTFDRLAPNRDLENVVTVKHRVSGDLDIIGMPASYTTGPLTGETSSRIGPADPIIDRVEGWSEERKEWIKGRWNYWSAVENSQEKNPHSLLRGE